MQQRFHATRLKTMETDNSLVGKVGKRNRICKTEKYFLLLESESKMRKSFSTEKSFGEKKTSKAARDRQTDAIKD